MAEIVEGDRRLELIFPMAATLLVTGYREVHARVATMPARAAGLNGLRGTPPTVEGMLENHRPDLMAIGPDEKRTPIIVDALPREWISHRDMLHRWELWSACRESKGWEVHFIVEDWVCEQILRARWADHISGYQPNRVVNLGGRS